MQLHLYAICAADIMGYILALYRFLWDEAETQGMGGMKKGNEVSNL